MQIERENRNCLYYGKYSYRVVYPIDSIGRFRYLDSIAEYHAHRIYYKNNPLDKIKSFTYDVTRFLDWRKSVKNIKNKIIRMEGDKIIVYSSDLQFLENMITRVAPESGYSIYISVTPPELDIMYFSKQPKYAYRIYFKEGYVDSSFGESLAKFMTDNAENEIDFCPSLKYLTNTWHNFTNNQRIVKRLLRSSYFIEYNDEMYHTLLLLLFSENLRCRVSRLMKRPEEN